MADYQYIDALLTVAGIIALFISVSLVAYVIWQGNKRTQHTSPRLMKEKREKERRSSELKSLFTPMDIAGTGIREDRRGMPDRRLNDFRLKPFP